MTDDEPDQIQDPDIDSYDPNFNFQEWLDNGGRDAIKDVQKYFRKRRYIHIFENLWLYTEQRGIHQVLTRAVPLLIWLALHQAHGIPAYVGVFDLTRLFP